MGPGGGAAPRHANGRDAIATQGGIVRPSMRDKTGEAETAPQSCDAQGRRGVCRGGHSKALGCTRQRMGGAGGGGGRDRDSALQADWPSGALSNSHTHYHTHTHTVTQTHRHRHTDTDTDTDTHMRAARAVPDHLQGLAAHGDDLPPPAVPPHRAPQGLPARGP